MGNERVWTDVVAEWRRTLFLELRGNSIPLLGPEEERRLVDALDAASVPDVMRDGRPESRARWSAFAWLLACVAWGAGEASPQLPVCPRRQPDIRPARPTCLVYTNHPHSPESLARFRSIRVDRWRSTGASWSHDGHHIGERR